MTWLLLAIGTISTVEAFLRLPIMQRGHDLKILLLKIFRVVTSQKISDHWKEKVLLTYAWRLFSISLLLLMFLLISVAPFVVLASISEAFNFSVFDLASSLIGIIASSFVAICYALFRMHFVL